MRQLTGGEINILRKAIKKTLNRAGFIMFLKERLEKDITDYISNSLDSNFGFDIFRVIEGANNEGWQGQLILAFMAERPKEKSIYSLAYDLGLTGTTTEFHKGEEKVSEKGGLERLVNSTPFLDIEEVIFRLSEIKNKVCRIQVEKDGKIEWGTGFLVAPDLLLSNYHVFEQLIKKPEEVEVVVTCLFDFTIKAEEIGINTGNTFAISSDNPVVAFSPYSEKDIKGGELDEDWADDHLDYALIRLKEEAGALPFGLKREVSNSEKERGWVNMPKEKPNFVDAFNLIIVQHPDKQPMKVVFGFEGLVGMDEKESRIRYNVNTLPGSSGSPVFNNKFELVALHNMGDPNWSAPTFNQGISMWKIVEDLKNKNISLNDFNP